MLTKAELLKLLAEHNRALVDLLWSSKRKDDAPGPAPEPPPRKLRQSEQPAIDMRAMGLDAMAEARARSLRALRARKKAVP